MANQTIVALKRHLQKHENKTAEMNDKSTAVLMSPDGPENLAVRKHLTSNVRSKSVASKEFAQMFKELQGESNKFRTLVFAAHDTRPALVKETNAVQEGFQKLTSDINSCV